MSCIHDTVRQLRQAYQRMLWEDERGRLCTVAHSTDGQTPASVRISEGQSHTLHRTVLSTTIMYTEMPYELYRGKDMQ